MHDQKYNELTSGTSQNFKSKAFLVVANSDGRVETEFQNTRHHQLSKGVRVDSVHIIIFIFGEKLKQAIKSYYPITLAWNRLVVSASDKYISRFFPWHQTLHRSAHRSLLLGAARPPLPLATIRRDFRGVEDLETQEDGIGLVLHTEGRPLVLDGRDEGGPPQIDPDTDLLVREEVGEEKAPSPIAIEPDACRGAAWQTCSGRWDEDAYHSPEHSPVLHCYW